MLSIAVTETKFQDQYPQYNDGRGSVCALTAIVQDHHQFSTDGWLKLLGDTLHTKLIDKHPYSVVHLLTAIKSKTQFDEIDDDSGYTTLKFWLIKFPSLIPHLYSAFANKKVSGGRWFFLS